MKDNSLRLENINLKGFKSIDSKGVDIPFGDITVLLGANGVGKSNLISFFQMLHQILSQELQLYIGLSGSANSLLHFGSKHTREISAVISFSNKEIDHTYQFQLLHTADDSLVFSQEEIVSKNSKLNTIATKHTHSGVKESFLKFAVNDAKHAPDEQRKTILPIFSFLDNFQVFQFHDTSKESKIRNSGYVNDGNFLRSRGENLAAFLYAIKNQAGGRNYYDRIIRYIKLMMPQFKDFSLKPSALNNNNIMLNWLDSDAEYLFGPHQLSDGSLRFMALATLLLQPHESQPSVIILDEPELGLHPSAISLLAGMIKTASQNCQIILATQSTSLIDEFDADDIVIVERNEKEKSSTFKKLDQEKLADWLDRYSLSEIWEKNIIGGKP